MNMPSARRPRILIASTPKTGTTWLRHLFGALYDIPVADLPPAPDFDTLPAPGAAWVIQSHVTCDKRVLAWVKRHGVSVVTSARHPADVLISLYHYTRGLVSRPETAGQVQAHERLLADAPSPDAPSVTEFIRHHLFYYLNHTLSWMRAPGVRFIRYEDLRRDPVGILAEVTRDIRPVSRDKIERVVTLNSIDNLRRWSDSGSLFFREGTSGGWRRSLSAEQIRLFETLQPYPTQLAMMGYDMDPNNPLWSQSAIQPAIHNPFEGVTQFDNGASIPAVCIRMYFSVDTAEAARWLPIERVDRPGSFFRWLVAPAAEDAGPARGLPPISNLAAFIHSISADLQARYPSVLGRDRIDYLLGYFLVHAQADYQLDDALIEPARAAFVAWANAPARDDPEPGRTPLISNLAMHIYNRREDHRLACPDVFDHDRWNYASWFLRYAEEDYAVPRACIQPVIDSMTGRG